MRQRIGFTLPTFGLALAFAIVSAPYAGAMQELPDKDLARVTVGVPPDCQEVGGQKCYDGPAEYCWLNDSDPNNKRCMETCNWQLWACECPTEGCDENPEDCRPCKYYFDLGLLPPSESCQALCADHTCEITVKYSQCGTGATICTFGF